MSKSEEESEEKILGIDDLLRGFSSKFKTKAQKVPKKNLDLSYKITAQFHRKDTNVWKDVSPNNIVCNEGGGFYTEQPLGPNGQLEYVIRTPYSFDNIFEGSDKFRVTVFNENGKDRIEKVIDLPEDIDRF